MPQNKAQYQVASKLLRVFFLMVLPTEVQQNDLIFIMKRMNMQRIITL